MGENNPGESNPQDDNKGLEFTEEEKQAQAKFDEELKDKSPEEQIELLKEKNGQLFGRAKSAEKKLASKKEDPGSDPGKQTEKNETQADLPIEAVLKLRSEGYSDSDILEAAQEAKSLGVSLDKYLDNPTIKKGIEAKREEAKIAAATPSPSSASSIDTNIGGKNFNEMSREDKEKNFSAHVTNIHNKVKRG